MCNFIAPEFDKVWMMWSGLQALNEILEEVGKQVLASDTYFSYFFVSQKPGQQ